MILPTEAGHWYDIDGNPVHEVEKKAGGLRPTTLRDARKMVLCPSVTTIFRIVRDPGLDIWLQKNLLLASLTLPGIEGESSDDFVQRVIADADEQRKVAAEAGTAIHAAIEIGLLGGDCPPEYQAHFSGVKKLMYRLFPEAKWEPEKSFATDGYGGKVDLFSRNANVVIDFKTKDMDATKNPNKMAYPKYGMQLAAYGHGVGLKSPRLFNFFVSTRVPGLVVPYEWENTAELKAQFDALFTYWKLANKYQPPTQ